MASLDGVPYGVFECLQQIFVGGRSGFEFEIDLRLKLLGIDEVEYRVVPVGAVEDRLLEDHVHATPDELLVMRPIGEALERRQLAGGNGRLHVSDATFVVGVLDGLVVRRGRHRVAVRRRFVDQVEAVF